VLSGHGDRVHAVTFAPGGRALLTSSEDRTARVWTTDPEQVAAQVCALAYPRVTAGEWTRFFPGLDYRPPCEADH
jgi:WD40 repeat protein